MINNYYLKNERFTTHGIFVFIFLLLLIQAVNAQVNFTQHIVASNFDGASSVHAADVDSDGDIDIMGCAFYGDELTLWINPGDTLAGWPATVLDSTFDGAHFVNTGDLDNDGDLDIVAVAQLAGDVVWFRNDGGNPVTWTKFAVDATYAGAQQVFPVDMDGDSDLDLVCTAYNLNDVSWYCNDGGDNLVWTKHRISNTVSGPVSVCVSDLDSDGDCDVLTAAYNNGRISWWRNDSLSYKWSEIVIKNGFSGAHEVRTGDLDGDGDEDILGASFSLSDIKYWRNDGGYPIVWTELPINTNFAGASSVSCADIDGDGDLDVLGAAHIAGDFAWWSNEGGQPISWTQYIFENNFAEAWPVIAYDIDLDNDMDILVGGRAIDRISWYENSTISSVPKITIPDKPRLQQNYPNPFNPGTNIRYYLDFPSSVKLNIYNLSGEEIASLVNGRQNQGEHEIAFNGMGYSSGLYFYKLTVNGQSEIKRMLLIK